jgi:hypothetical protein
MATMQETACTPGREQLMVDGRLRSATYVAFIGFVDLIALSSLDFSRERHFNMRTFSVGDLFVVFYLAS